MPRNSKPLAQKLAERAAPAGDCLLWFGPRTTGGYGRIYRAGTTALVHRVAWELVRGPIPSALVVDHVCRQRNCINVAHMRIVTPRINSTENSVSVPALNAQKTSCRKGHPFTPENTYTFVRDGTVRRQCRQCSRISALAYYERNREAIRAKRSPQAISESEGQ